VVEIRTGHAVSAMAVLRKGYVMRNMNIRGAGDGGLGEKHRGQEGKKRWHETARRAVLATWQGRSSRLIAALVLLVALMLAPPASAGHLTCQGVPTTIDGTSGNDSISGTVGDDVINADAGNDRVEGNGGNDRICGGEGNDRLTAVGGVDRLDGGSGNDRLTSGAENDVLFGGPGEDRLFGEAGIDAFIGGPGDDQLRGGDGFADQAQYFDSPSGVDVNLSTGIAIGHGTDTLFGIQHLVGSNLDDTLTGNAGSNSFIAMLGDDIIDGAGGFDGIENNFLPDPVTVDLAAGTVTGQGEDQLLSIESAGGTVGADQLFGSDGPDTVTGRAGDDHIEGRGGHDNLAGNEGEDFIDGGQGTDTADGGPESDTCVAAETTIDCEARALSIVTVDSRGTVGQFTSIDIGADGDPIVSYEDLTNFDLKFADCANLSCSAASLSIVDGPGIVGEYTSLALGADGLPVISYLDETNDDLRVAHCGNASCPAGVSLTSVDTAGDVGRFTSIAIGTDHLPVISYFDFSNVHLKVAHCSNEACSAFDPPTTVDADGFVGAATSIAIGEDDLPVISYTRLTDFLLKVAHCANARCASVDPPTTVDAGGLRDYTSIAIGSDGLPVISYFDRTNGDLRVAHCGDFSCTAGNSLTTVDALGEVGLYTSIAIGLDGLPAISYLDGTNGDLKLAHCGNMACTAGNSLMRVDATGFVGGDTSITIGLDGVPVVSYFDFANGDLKLARVATS